MPPGRTTWNMARPAVVDSASAVKVTVAWVASAWAVSDSTSTWAKAGTASTRDPATTAVPVAARPSRREGFMGRHSGGRWPRAGGADRTTRARTSGRRPVL